jgi:excinuclease Cho
MAKRVDFAHTQGLYGPFSSQHAARQFLLDLADQQRLCLDALGLERRIGTRGCFRSALGRCAGVCRDQETRAAHDERLLAALQAWRMRTWPHEGSVAIVESDASRTDYLVVNNWCFLGRAHSLEDARALRDLAADFDADGYRILCRPLVDANTRIIPLG